jgi:hypothetical protein
MSPYLLPLGFIALVYIAMIVLNERYGLFAADRFPSFGAKIAAYAWLGLLLFGLTITVIISLVIGFTFYWTKNLLPGIIAHGSV